MLIRRIICLVKRKKLNVARHKLVITKIISGEKGEKRIDCVKGIYIVALHYSSFVVPENGLEIKS